MGRKKGTKSFTEDDKRKIINCYLELKNQQAVGRKLGLSGTGISKVLSDAKIDIFNKHFRTKSKSKCRKYVDLFDTLSDDLKGYFCGLLATDGTMVKDRKAIQISLQEDDQATIEFMSEKLAQPSIKVIHTQETKRLNRKAMKRITATLPKLYQYCMEMGITPAKSLTLDVKLDDKSDEFKWYFLRGVIDGDGCVSASDSLTKSSIQIFSASKSFIHTLQSYFGGRIRVETCHRVNPKYILQFQGRRAKQLITKLPLDCFTMQRKTNKLVYIRDVVPIKHVRVNVGLVGLMWDV